MKQILKKSVRDIDSTLLYRSTYILYDQVKVALFTNIIASLLYTTVMLNAIPHITIILWLSILILFAVLRIFLVYQYTKSSDELRESKFWFNLFVVSTVVMGCIWGSTVFLLSTDETVYETITVLFLCGLTSGAVATLAISRVAFLAFMIPALIPGMIFLSLTDSYICNFLSATMFIYSCFLTLTAFNTNRRLIQGLFLEIENAGLVKELSLEKKQIERFNEKLEIQVEERTIELNKIVEELRLTQFVIEHSTDAVYQINPDASFVYVNNVACERHGYSSDELSNMSVFDIDIEFPQKKWHDHWLKLKKEKSLMFESKHIKRDGTIFPVETRVDYITYRGKEYAYSFVRDITERKLAEERLNISEEKYAKAFSSCPDAIAITTLDEGCFVEVNDTFIELTGYSREEILGKTVEEFKLYVNPEDRVNMLTTLKNKHKVRNMPAPIRRRSGKVGMAELSAEIIEFNDKLCLLAMVRDVTEQEDSKEALKEAEKKLRLLLNSTAEAIYGIDLNGNCTFANVACVKVLGYRNQAMLVGKNMHNLIHHTYVDGRPHAEYDCNILQTYKHGKSTKVDDDIFWRLDGTSFPVEYWSKPMYRDDKVIGCVVNFVNVTERREKESQLIHAQKMEVIGQLTGGIAHDFNNLLTIIIGNLKFLKEEIGDQINEEDQALINAALTAAWDGADLTHGLLAASRKQLLQPKNIDVNIIADEFLYLTRRTLGANISISLNKWGRPAHVYADPAQLKNALFNLAINARDAMPEGGEISLDIKCEKVSDNSAVETETLAQGFYVIISMTDDGEGMTEEEVGKVFDPFFSTKEAGRGTGLGLSTVYGFSKQSGGKTEINSRIGEGTTISIFLPIIDAYPESSLDDSIEEALTIGTETILVIEDEEGVRTLAVKILTRLGYTVLQAENAEAAVEIMKMGNNIDMLFSDIMMPGKMNGYDLSAWVLKNYPDIKVLLTSGFSKKSNVETAVLPVSIPVLDKPYSKSELAFEIRSILDS